MQRIAWGAAYAVNCWLCSTPCNRHTRGWRTSCQARWCAGSSQSLPSNYATPAPLSERSERAVSNSVATHCQTQGLEDQLLGEVVRLERPDLEEAKDRLVVSISNDKRQLAELEDKVGGCAFVALVALLKRLRRVQRCWWGGVDPK